MIQRVQTLYLLGVVASLATLFYKSAAFITSAKTHAGMLADAQITGTDHNIFSILIGVAILLALVSIFLFRNRKVQLTLNKVNLALIVGLMIAIPVLSYLEIRDYMNDVQPNIGWAWILTILAIIFGVLASRAIKKDENLVKSMDRLR